METTLNHSLPLLSFSFLFSFFFLSSLQFSSYVPWLCCLSLFFSLSMLLRRQFCPLKFPLLLIDGARSCFLHSEI